MDGEAELVAQYMGLVCNWAGRYSGLTISYDDARSAGSIGLLAAARRYLSGDYDQKFAFSSLATMYIRSNIIDAYRAAVGRWGKKQIWVQSLDFEGQEFDDGQERPCVQYIGGNSEDEAISASIGSTLWSVVNRLPERNALIITWYYRDGMRMREIAELLNISESRIAQLHAASMVELKLLLGQQGFESMPAVDYSVAI